MTYIAVYHASEWRRTIAAEVVIHRSTIHHITKSLRPRRPVSKRLSCLLIHSMWWIMYIWFGGHKMYRADIEWSEWSYSNNSELIPRGSRIVSYGNVRLGQQRALVANNNVALIFNRRSLDVQLLCEQHRRISLLSWASYGWSRKTTLVLCDKVVIKLLDFELTWIILGPLYGKSTM